MLGMLLTGGGVRGAHQVGMLKYLAEHNLLPEGIPVVSGSSVGALNALAIASFPQSDSQLHQASELLLDTWNQIKQTNNIWRKQFPPYIAGLWKASIGDSTPLRRLLEATVDVDRIRNSHIKLHITATDLISGRLVVFREYHRNLVDAVMGSTAYPGVFPPVEYKGMLLADGGVKDLHPLKPLIDAGCDKIIILSTRHPSEPYKMPAKKLGTLSDALSRVVTLASQEYLAQDIKRLQKTNRHIKRKQDLLHKEIQLIVCHPIKPLQETLNFSEKIVQSYIAQGYSDAKGFGNAIKSL